MTKLKDKQKTREAAALLRAQRCQAVVLAKKEQAYAKWVGWDQLGDEDDPESDDEDLREA